MVKFRRYNKYKRGSLEISIWLYDHEISGIIEALRLAQKHHLKKNTHKGYVTFLKHLEKKMNKALSELLKAESKDKRDERIEL